MNARRSHHLKVGLLALLLLFLGAASGGAATYDITAEPTTLTMPDGFLVPAWGYKLTGSTNATVPGPEIRVPAGDTTLIINLTNNLPEATSLQILGQTMTAPGSPTYVDGRVMSFVKETANGATLEYRWDNLNPGTYMLQSATNPAKQVQMGLYAPVVNDSAAGMAYAGVPYDTDRVLVFHEIDPEIHAAIDGGTYGPGGAITSSVFRHPTYFLINGAGYPQTSLEEVASGETVLLRFVNAGLETHSPMILDKFMTVVAQDGQPKTYPQETYGFELNAAATMDALVFIDGGDINQSFAIHDGRNRYLTNAGESAAGGMIVNLNVGSGTPADTVTILRARFNAANQQLRVWATTDDPGATLTVSAPIAGAITATDFTDDNVLNGAFTRLYVAGVAANPGSVTVASSSGGTASTPVPSTVAPEAFGDAYATDQGVDLTVAAPGLLANDLKGGWLVNSNALRAVLQTAPGNGSATLNADGSFTYTPAAGFSGQDSFTYVAEAYNTNNNNLLATSAPATVTVYVNPGNSAPTALDDGFTGTEGSVLNVPAPGVLANDSDPENASLTAILDTDLTGGTLSFNSDGSFSFDGPAGAHTFTYVAHDGQANSAPATVTIDINDLPMAADDAYGTDSNVTLDVAAPGVMANDTDTIPAGGSLTAAVVTTTGQGILTFNQNGAFSYAPGFNFSGVDTFTYTVTDSLGAISAPATATITVNDVADTVTITRLRWRNNQTRIRIIATSDAPAGSVVMTASANFNDGNPAQVLGTLNYNAGADAYRRTLSFDTSRGLPVSVTVTSSQGGSDTESIPYTLP
jgi:hypothetical protein